MKHNKSGPTPKPVRCVETGQVFESCKVAAQHVGAHQSNFSKALNNRRYTCKGYHWEYVVDADEDEGAALLLIERPGNLRRPPSKTIYDVQEEAMRRTEQTGRLVRYAHIQKEETVQLIRERDRLERLKRSVDDG